MLFPFIPARLHGWLDELVTLTYLAGAYLLGLGGAPLWVALGGAGVHFALTRTTNYPQGTFKVIPFRTHAYVELAEGLALLAAAAILAPDTAAQRAFLPLMGLSQLTAFSFSDYRWPVPATGR